MHQQICSNYNPRPPLQVRKLFRPLLLMVALSAGFLIAAAQPGTLYFMKGIPQIKDLNPARPGIKKGFYISLPMFSKLDLESATNGWNYNDLIHKGTGTRADSLVIDLDLFISKLDKNNFLAESAALTFVEGGFKRDKNFFGLSLSERVSGQLSIDRNLAQLIKYGNYPRQGQTIYSGRLGATIQQFHEIRFNFSRDVSKQLTVGFAAKALFGTGALHTGGFYIRNSSPLTGTTLDLTAVGRVNISGPISVNHNQAGQITNITQHSGTSLGSYLGNLGNPGFAADLGFAYRISTTTEVSASLIDLGVLLWRQNLTQVIENGQFTYSGVDLNDPTQAPPYKPVLDKLGKDLSNAFTPDYSSDNFSTLLPTRFYLGIDHQLSEGISISGLARAGIVSNTVQTSFTAAANTLILEILSLSASYTVMRSGYDNAGLGAGLRIGPFQIYGAADNLFSILYPATASNLNLRIGINLLFPNARIGRGPVINPDCNCPY